MKDESKKVMSPEDFAKYMERHSYSLWPSGGRDYETAHKRMDRLMCRVLIDLGYGDGVKIFENTPKWYA